MLRTHIYKRKKIYIWYTYTFRTNTKHVSKTIILVPFRQTNCKYTHIQSNTCSITKIDEFWNEEFGRKSTLIYLLSPRVRTLFPALKKKKRKKNMVCILLSCIYLKSTKKGSERDLCARWTNSVNNIFNIIARSDHKRSAGCVTIRNGYYWSAAQEGSVKLIYILVTCDTSSRYIYISYSRNVAIDNIVVRRVLTDARVLRPLGQC